MDQPPVTLAPRPSFLLNLFRMDSLAAWLPTSSRPSTPCSSSSCTPPLPFLTTTPSKHKPPLPEHHPFKAQASVF